MKIKNREALFATVNFTSVKIFTLALQSIINIGKNAAWLFFLINAAFTALMFTVVYFLCKKSGYKDIFSIVPPFFKKVLGIIFAAYFVISSSFMLDILIKSVIKTFMPDSPTPFIAAFFIPAIIYGAMKGIKSNVSLAVIIAPLLSFAIVVFTALLPYADFTNFFPLLGNNDFYIKALWCFNFFSDFYMFILIMPYLENREKALKTGLTAILITTLLSLMLIASSVMTIPQGVKFFSPFYYMVSFLAGSRSAVNFVKILKLIFLLNFLLYFSTAIAFASHSLKKGFSLKYEKEITLSLSLCLLLIAETGFGAILIPFYDGFMKYSFFVFPIVPFVCYLFSKKEGRVR